MFRFFVASLAVMAGAVSPGNGALAQDAAQAVYIVSYVEIAPASVAEAKKLILAYSAEAKKASGAVQVEALQRISDPSHFGLIEHWQSQAAKQAFAATAATTTFRAALAPLQSAAFDERTHADLSTGAAKSGSADPIMVLTHVDVIPPATEGGTTKVKAFAEQGRAAPGNRRFDVVVQANRKNHFTVIEGWDQASDKSNWISTKTAKTFREELHPMSGALYDERIYKVLR
jgi:quinol monooxygenase YgiN